MNIPDFITSLTRDRAYNFFPGGVSDALYRKKLNLKKKTNDSLYNFEILWIGCFV